MSWKQPIPTNLKQLFEDDHTTRLVFVELLLRARNSDNERPEKLGRVIHYLKKGQCVCGMKELAKCVNSNSKAVKKSLEILQKRYSKLDIKATSKGTVVTIKSFDEVIKMGEPMGKLKESQGKAKGKLRDTIKSVKSVKSVKKKRVRTYKSTETNKKYTLDQTAIAILGTFNREMNTKFKSVKPILSGLEFWLDTYAPNEIEKAIIQIPFHPFWKDKMTPTMLFRRRNPRGESVDYLGELINSRRKKWNQ